MIEVDTIETAGLGDRSYLATDGTRAIVVDPQRDIDRVLAVLDGRDVQLTHVFETHIHNDYVTGGLELARRLGADYVLSAADQVSYECRAIGDGDVLAAGDMRVRALHTPGHTFHHLSYALEDPDGGIHGVFTGGSLLYGTTGRTDLLGDEYSDLLSHEQHASVRRLAAELPPDTPVFPTHGFGSFCTATPAGEEESTIGEQTQVNPALTMDEQAYVESLLTGFDAYPAYYTRIAPINRQGPPSVDLSLPAKTEPGELRRRIDGGEWVVDLRDRADFAAGHLAGTLGFELSDSFVSNLGWLYPWGTPLTLIGESLDQVREARRELVRIGVDTLAGFAVGDIEYLAGGHGLQSYPVADFAGLAAAMKHRDLTVLDVRRNDERATGGVRGSLHMPIHDLLARANLLPGDEIWVYCSSGYRSAIAASILDRLGRPVVLVSDDYEAAKQAGLEG